jgi:hypothetical protein
VALTPLPPYKKTVQFCGKQQYIICNDYGGGSREWSEPRGGRRGGYREEWVVSSHDVVLLPRRASRRVVLTVAGKVKVVRPALGNAVLSSKLIGPRIGGMLLCLEFIHPGGAPPVCLLHPT